MSAALSRPSLTPTLRVNTLKAQPEEVLQKLRDKLNRRHVAAPPLPTALPPPVSPAAPAWGRPLAAGGGCAQGHADPWGAGDDAAQRQRDGQAPRLPPPRLHPRVPAAVVLSGAGPNAVEHEPGLPEAVINRFAAEAVLKGAHVYAPGLLAASTGIAAGDLVVVSTAIERPVVPRARLNAATRGNPVRPVGLRSRAAAAASDVLLAGDAADTAAPSAFSAEAAVAAAASPSPRGSRLAVGLSRGATVRPDGSVPLAWARQVGRRPGAAAGSAAPGRLHGAAGGCEPGAAASGGGSPEATRLLPAEASGGGSPDGSSCVGGSPEATRLLPADGSLGGDLPRRGCGRGGGQCSGDLSDDDCGSGGRHSEGSSSDSEGSSSSSRSGRGSGGARYGDDDDGDQDLGGGGGGGGDCGVADEDTSSRADRPFLGLARAELGRRAMFRAQQGLVLRMERRVYEVPSCNGILPGEVMLQALPSIVAAQALSPRPGSRVIDMCAAPGGKSTLLAALMGNRGRLVALDRTAAKVGEILSLARDLGATCVEAYKADATEAVTVATTAATTPAAAAAVQPPGHSLRQPEPPIASAVSAAVSATAAVPSGLVSSSQPSMTAQLPAPAAGATPAGAATTTTAVPAPGDAAGSSQLPAAKESAPSARPVDPPFLGPPPYAPGSFDYVLLDPPCSALGLRPRLLHSWTLPQLRAMAAYQRSLLHTAVQLLAPGGEMVYCTCTINPDENEANVAWALDRFAGQLELLPAEPLLGLPGLTGSDPQTGDRWLRPEEAPMVQRFDPGLLLPGRRMAPSEASSSGGGGFETPGGRSSPVAGAAVSSSGSPSAPDANRSSPSAAADCGSGSPAGGDGRRGEEEEEEEWPGDEVMGFFIARFRKVV